MGTGKAKMRSAPILLEGPFEGDYSLAVVNRNLALALIELGCQVSIHQRDNTQATPVSARFRSEYPRLTACALSDLNGTAPGVHSRYIYPPHCDSMWAGLRAVHCFGWEESGFPARYARGFNHGLGLITVMSRYVRDVLRANGVTIPIEVCGLGADHILRADPQPVSFWQPGAFTFLHVSSGFPRKGVDVLVEAFCAEFGRDDDVRLIIKTFANPHNRIDEILREAFTRHPRHALVDVVEEPITGGQMRFLLEHANGLVSPSRGEGFGLPVAEAMLVGCPVIATLHGGQAETCSPDWCWPVDFALRPAETHLSEGPSVWAEPSVASLRDRMRQLWSAPQAEIQARTARARAHVGANFTWEKVAGRHVELWERRLGQATRWPKRATRAEVRRIGFVSTWNVRCGIAEYTRYLAENLGPGVNSVVFAAEANERVRADGSEVVRCWTQSSSPVESWDEAGAVVSEILKRDVNLVSLQFNFSFFAPEAVEHLVDELHRAGIPVFVTLHATDNERFERLAVALRNADLTIVHREEDARRLAAHGVERWERQEQGIVAFPDGLARPHCAARMAFTVACFGFFLRKKGIHELLRAFAAAVRIRPQLRLTLLNALYPIEESERYAASCLELARRLAIAPYLKIWTEFLDEESILRELHASDLVVLPYLTSTESSSAAIRLPLASGTPVLCSSVPLFDEFGDAVHRYPVGDVAALANRIAELAGNPHELHRFSARQREHVERLSWPRVGDRFRELIRLYAESARDAAPGASPLASGAVAGRR